MMHSIDNSSNSALLQHRFDVVILGGGINGSLMGLNLLKHLPGLSILILEKQAVFGQKIGESTSEISSMFLHRLGIAPILQKQTRKTGLRFFFDENGKTLEFSSPSRKSIANGYHFDRAVLDTDLIEECKKKGISVWQPALLNDLDVLDDANRLSIEFAGDAIEVISKWFIDASGRFRFLYKKFQWKDIPLKLNTAAIATHFVGIPSNESWDTPQTRHWSKVGIGLQEYSTLHFMRKHYWFWFIKINEERASVGMVYDKNKVSFSGSPQEFFLDTIKNDALLSKALKGAKHDEIKALKHLPYLGSKFHYKNTAVLGDAGAFVDPMFSPGLDFVCQQNEQITQLLSDYFKSGKKDEKKWERYNQVIVKANLDRDFVYSNVYFNTHSYDIFSNIAQFVFFGYQTFTVIPSARCPKKIKKISTLNRFTKMGTHLVFSFYNWVSNKREQEKRGSSSLSQPVNFSRIGIPKNWTVIFKPFDLFFNWFYSFIRIFLDELLWSVRRIKK